MSKNSINISSSMKPMAFSCQTGFRLMLHILKIFFFKSKDQGLQGYYNGFDFKSLHKNCNFL